MSACSHLPDAPLAPERPTVLEAHGEKRVDPYYWLRERENPEVVKYLQAENAYLERAMLPVKGLREKLYGEMRSRIKEDDSSVPFERDGWLYYSRFETGKEYPIYARRKKGADASEEILINVNELAKGHSYFSLPFPDPSPDGTKLLYAVDTQGRRFYNLYVKDLKSGAVIGTAIENTTGNSEWAEDGKTIFYSKQDPETLRSRWVFRRELGQKTEELVYEEKDETFNVGVGKARTNAYLFIVSGSTLSTEWRYLDAKKPKGKFIVFQKREPNHEYSLDDGVDGFYVVTNWQAKNFRLMKAMRGATFKEDWEEVVPHRPDVLLEGADFFKGYYVLSERKDGLARLTVTNRKTGNVEPIAFPDPTYVVGVSTNAMYDLPYFRYEYESLNRPSTIFDYDFAKKMSTLRKQRETPNLNPALYASERVWATARDGAQVPVSLVYKKGIDLRKAPLFVDGYGSYGISSEPSFGISYFSLLDRGFIYAIPHIRGGSEMGRHWYEDGKLLKKMNTFHDFIDATEHLLRAGYGAPGHVHAEGGSAGGLLMGAVINLRPDLYRGVHAAVPFVDVLTTMLDENVPLTTSEYDEWGDPRKPEYYRYMRQYSPYDNIERKAYPNLLVTTGFHDSQVQYWEPAKWVARLRTHSTGDSLILLETKMDTGHSGATGRFERLKEAALSQAFAFMLEGIDE